MMRNIVVPSEIIVASAYIALVELEWNCRARVNLLYRNLLKEKKKIGSFDISISLLIAREINNSRIERFLKRGSLNRVGRARSFS